MGDSLSSQTSRSSEKLPDSSSSHHQENRENHGKKITRILYLRCRRCGTSYGPCECGNQDYSCDKCVLCYIDEFDSKYINGYSVEQILTDLTYPECPDYQQLGTDKIRFHLFRRKLEVTRRDKNE